MIRLGNREPVWLDLAEGVRLKLRPITTPAYAMIQAQAERVFDDWAEHRAENEGLDPADPSVRRGLMRALMIKGLALYAITEWEGIEGPVTDNTVAGFIDENPLLAALFYHRYLAPLEERTAEGNAFGPAPHGISAAGRDIAKPATETVEQPAPTANTNP
ncbi:conserved hypothetical protein [Rhodospirillaceae bacterium LM-1]|nr:conserved hypothetical protein [Rhodospirillaceae bacterium LM-1]